MSRPPKHSAELKMQVVLSVLQGEMSMAEAARRSGVSETSIGKWKQQFLEAGKAGLEARERRGPTGEEARLHAQVDELTRALGEAHVELRVLKRGGPAGFPSQNWR
jgi:transposase